MGLIERDILVEEMGGCVWLFEGVSGEYGYDFGTMAKFLRKNRFLTKNPKKTPINFLVNLIVLFKNNKDGYYVIQPSHSMRRAS